MPFLETKDYLHNIDLKPKSIYIVHERLERLLPLHSHSKHQLTYVEGGIAYIHAKGKSYLIPARHYVWIPTGVDHYLRVRSSATVTRNLYFYVENDYRPRISNGHFTDYARFRLANRVTDLFGIDSKDAGTNVA